MQQQQQPQNKWELPDDYDEVFALVFNDPEGGPEVLKELLKKTDLAREDLEDAAQSLSDAGMKRAAKIVSEFAQGQPSEDTRDFCPWPEHSTNAKNWHQSQPMRQQSRRAWRLEKRRRKREGTW